MKNFAAFLVSFGLATGSISAWAQNAYFGLGFGQASLDIAPCGFDISCTSDESDTAIKVFGGVKFNPNLAVEAAFIYGGEYSQSGTDSSLGTATANIEVRGINLAVLGFLPVSERFSLQGKVGLFIWDMDVTVRSITFAPFGYSSFPESGTDPMFGIGGTINISKQIGILVEYETFLDVGNAGTTGKFDINVLSGSLVYRF